MFELTNCEYVLLNEVKNNALKPEDIAKTYSLALRSQEKVNWKKVNAAIVKRWSFTILEKIKREAWERIECQTL